MRFRVQPIGEDDNPDEEQFEAKPIEVVADNAIEAIVRASSDALYEGVETEWCPDDVVECADFKFRVSRLDMNEEEKAMIHKINTDPDSPFRGMID